MGGKPAISWMQQPWCAFDTETTGVDVENDHILSAAIIHINGSTLAIDRWLLNWGIPIPPESTKIHGLTREMLATEGVNPADALLEMCLTLTLALRNGPIVGMNLVFDLTMLDRNCRRAGVKTLSNLGPVVPVVDAYVLDKYVDPFRKGKRNLSAIAEHYNVHLGDAHTADADAHASARVLWRIGQMFPEVGAMDAVLLHELQQQQKKGQDESLRQYLLKKGENATGLDGQWPLRTVDGQGEPPW